MSDDDFMQDSEQEDYEFEYEDDDADQGGDVDVENRYYNAKQLKVDSPESAIEQFLQVPALEGEKGDWGFKALKQAIKLEFRLGQYDKAIEHYQELLTYVKSAVTRNYSDKSINNMLDFMDKNAENAAANECMEKIYSMTLHAFHSSNNERLWLKTNTKLARLWLDQHDYRRLADKVRELHKACQTPDGQDDPTKGTYSHEVYALEIAMYAETRNLKRMKTLYEKALRVRSAVPHPRIMGIIRECGGKMHMSERNWKEAQIDFFESFRNYDEAGSLQRIQVLKYLVLTTMLMKSDINPFESQETKPYRDDPRVAGMTELLEAYQRDEIERYESALQKNKDLLDDSFFAENIDEVTRNMRIKGVLKLVAPYTRFRLSSIAEQLKISAREVQEIVIYIIMTGQLKGTIDLERGIVEVADTSDEQRAEALTKWKSALEGMSRMVLKEQTQQEDAELSMSMGTLGASAATGPVNRPWLVKTGKLFGPQAGGPSKGTRA